MKLCIAEKPSVGKEIARIVGVTSPAVAERIRKMEDADVIEGYYAKVSHFELGYDFRALITWKLQPFRFMSLL